MATREIGPLLDVVVRPEPDSVLVVLDEEVLAAFRSTGGSYRRALDELKSAMKGETGIDLEFAVMKSGRRQAIEAALEELMKDLFRGGKVECSVSFPDARTADVWLSLAQSGATIPQDRTAEIRRVIKQALALFGREPRHVVLPTQGPGRTSELQVLRTVKILQPCTSEELATGLLKRGVQHADVPKLSSILDLLRKRTLLSRSAAGRYSLTAGGLALVPKRKDRRSSDIERALALGKRKW